MKPTIRERAPGQAENGIFVAASRAWSCWSCPGVLVAFTWVALGQVAAVAVGLLALYAGHGGELRGLRASRSQATRLPRDSWPMILSGICS